MSGWSAALRAARHDVRANRGRTALVLALITLPVTAVVAGETLVRTAQVSVEESLPQRLGAADALVRDEGISGPVQQDPLLETTSYAGEAAAARRTTGEVQALLPAGSRLLPIGTGAGVVRTADGLLDVQTREVDLRDPLADGLFPLDGGRLPDRPGEVVVSDRLVRRGFGVGSRLPLAGGDHPVVGVVALLSSELGDQAVAVGLPGSLAAGQPTSWLAAVPGGVGWDQVQALNQASLSALSRAVVADPPPPADVPVSTSNGDGAFLALVVTLALLQVVLLAAPAFAVGARRQKRVLALLGATGAEPAQVRRFVLAQGVVLGGLGGLGGAALGVGAAAALRPAMSRFGVEPGPFDVSVRDAVLTAAIGALSAVLAALVPALVAGKQDVLAGLTGRRGATGRSLPSLGLGAVLLGVGVAGCVAAARPDSSEYAAVLAAVPTVVGAALLAPALLALAARHARRLPFALRFAVRDAARTRGRTAAAAAAVTATVAGVVALGIGASSDGAQAAATWSPDSPVGSALVTYQSGQGQDDRVRAAVEEQLPGHRVQVLTGLRQGPQLTVEEPDGMPVLSSYGGNLDATALVGDSGLALLGLQGDRLDRAREQLAGGGIVVAADHPSRTGDLVVVLTRGSGKELSRAPLPALRVAAPGGSAPVLGVVSPATAARLGVASHTVGLLVDGPVTVDQEQRLQEQLAALGADPAPDPSTVCTTTCSVEGRSPGFVSVERGYDGDGSAAAQLVLAGVGAVLVLGGTLSASLLALSDARPDFATLGAVGAAPGVRRAVAAAYAAVIGLLGAVLGALAGLLPGIAVSYPLTRAYADVEGLPSHFLDVPWLLLLGVAVGVPLVAALGAAALTRARLPMTARGVE